ncbi:apolipoprotein N-acyltransferase [Fontivita pretiosa]|uniref:apolipoprotein N-acyltransferase n=1 Tax=Fontivita pretiosa TaxID=2989684 RepID=UPI003D16249D
MSWIGTTESTGVLRRMALLVASALLLFAALAPVGQFYLAWIGLVPWLVAVRPARTVRAAFGWGWLGGAAFFAFSLGWLWRATIPGTIGLVLYLALFWGMAGALMHLGRLLQPRHAERTHGGGIFASAMLIAAIWTATEWLRGFLLSGFPWAFLGHTQSPLPTMCQIADFAGVYGVSFWVALINAIVLFAIFHPARRAVAAAAALTLPVLLGVLGYGIFRMAQMWHTIRPGPVVLVVQPNFPHERGGRQPVTQQQQIDFHFGLTRQALRQTAGGSATQPPVDLVVWSETVMPALNVEARTEPGLGGAAFLQQTHQMLSELTATHRVALITGGYFVGGWQGTIGSRRATDIRNAAFFYDRSGRQSEARYDKIHLVPFAEFLPLRESAPAIYRVLRWLAAYSVDYPLVAADPSAMTVFTLDGGDGDRVGSRSWRLVTPICFEDTDAALIARMFRPPNNASDPRRKRADILVNITNDGWFRGVQQAQHLQAAIFRSIENRVPTARADNTGISGFIDSVGRTHGLIPVRTAGTSRQRLLIDDRLTVYTRFGDVFAMVCVAVAAGVALWPLLGRTRRCADAV